MWTTDVRVARGFTLVETVLTIVVLGVASVGVLLVFTESVRASADPLIRAQALAIADSYMDEILQAYFTDPGGGAEAGRSDYDNVGDYNGLSDVGARDRTDAAIAGLEDYTVAVTVQNSGNLNGLASGSVLRVTVTVTHTSGETLVLDGYKTNY